MAKKKKSRKSKVAKAAKRIVGKAKKAVKAIVRRVTAKKKKAPARKAAAKAEPAAKKKIVARKKVAVKKKAAGEYGEGNYKASKRFRTKEEAFIKTNKARIPAMAKAAEAALDGPEGDELRAAEAATAARGEGMER